MRSGIQEKELEMLMFLDDICKQNNIEYFLDSGTLIGAIRHQGFIPWDDDVDVILKREDYAKLIQVLNEENSKYVCHNIDEKNYVYPYAKLVDTTTNLHELGVKDNVELGIYIDIFALDKLPRLTGSQLIYFNIVGFLRWAAIVLSKEAYSDNSVKAFFKRILEVLPNNTFAGLTDIFAKLFYKRKKFEYYTGVLCTGKKYKYIKKEWFAKAQYINFEGISLPVPSGYDDYLTMLYGNYMEIPPKNKQEIHNIDVNL